MRRFFSSGNPVFRAIGRLGDLVALSLLWLLASLPVVTIGAASTALVSVSAQIACGSDISLLRGFFGEFKRAFGKATAVWLCLLPVGVLLSVDIYFWLNAGAGTPGLIMAAASLWLALMYLMILLYVFPIIAVYDGVSVWNTFKGALLVSVRCFFGSAALLLVIGGTVYLCEAFPLFTYAFALIGPGVLGWLFSFRFLRAFKKFGVIIAPNEAVRKDFAGYGERVGEPEENVSAATGSAIPTPVWSSPDEQPDDPEPAEPPVRICLPPESDDD